MSLIGGKLVLTLEEGVKKIEKKAFRDVDIIKINLPKSIETATSNAFSKDTVVNVVIDRFEIVTK